MSEHQVQKTGGSHSHNDLSVYGHLRRCHGTELPATRASAWHRPRVCSRPRAGSRRVWGVAHKQQEGVFLRDQHTRRTPGLPVARGNRLRAQLILSGSQQASVLLWRQTSRCAPQTPWGPNASAARLHSVAIGLRKEATARLALRHHAFMRACHAKPAIHSTVVEAAAAPTASWSCVHNSPQGLPCGSPRATNRVWEYTGGGVVPPQGPSVLTHTLMRPRTQIPPRGIAPPGPAPTSPQQQRSWLSRNTGGTPSRSARRRREQPTSGRGGWVDVRHGTAHDAWLQIAT